MAFAGFFWIIASMQYYFIDRAVDIPNEQSIQVLLGSVFSIIFFFGIPMSFTFISFLLLKKIKNSYSMLLFIWVIVASSYYTFFAEIINFSKYHPVLVLWVVFFSLFLAFVITLWRIAYLQQKKIVRYLLPVIVLFSFFLGILTPSIDGFGSTFALIQNQFDLYLINYLGLNTQILGAFEFSITFISLSTSLFALAIYAYLIFTKKLSFKLKKPRLQFSIKIPSVLTIMTYSILLFFSFLFFSLLWDAKIHGVMYIETDYMPFLSFHPPFIHSALYGDYFMSSSAEVYLTWFIFVFLIIMIPLFIISIVQRNKKRIVTLAQSTILGFFLVIIYTFSQSTSLPPDNPPKINTNEYEQYAVKLGQNYAIAFIDQNKQEKIEFVGESAINLDQFIGQKVSINGEYRGGTTFSTCSLTNDQCIQGKCHNIFYWEKINTSATCVIDIENLAILSK